MKIRIRNRIRAINRKIHRAEGRKNAALAAYYERRHAERFQVYEDQVCEDAYDRYVQCAPMYRGRYGWAI